MGNSSDEDLEQIEWCRQWAAEHERKRVRRRSRFRTMLAWILAAARDEGREDSDIERKT